MNNRKVRQLIQELFKISDQLEAELPGRGLMPAGQQLGNLGEQLIADQFGLTLTPPMQKAIDAHAADGTKVQIKTTTSRGAGIPLGYEQPDGDVYLLAGLLNANGTCEVIFNGPMVLAWDIRQATPKSGGTAFVSKGPLKRLAKGIPAELQLKPSEGRRQPTVEHLQDLNAAPRL